MMDFLPDDWTTRIIGFVLMFFGGMLIRTASATEKKSSEALTWSSVEGEVLASSVKRSPSSSKPRFRAHVNYRYSVNGQGYENDTVFLGGRVATLKKKAQATSDKYAVGTSVTVYYDASNPGDSYLENAPQGLAFQKFAGAIVLLAGLLFLFGYLPQTD
ncbi:MAG: DUF3592 domain-containing protein [Pseudomonadota bacterium]